jgi:membrane dipeptidase
VIELTRNLKYFSRYDEERARRIHKTAIVVDAHCDTVCSWINIHNKGKDDISRMKEGGVNCQVFAIYTAPSFYDAPLKRAVQLIDSFYIEIENNRNNILLCTDYKQILLAEKQEKIAAILALEGGEPIQGGVSLLRTLYRLGVRIVSFTHFPRNLIADGSGEASSKSGLTFLGNKLVKEMNRIGMIIDISHINENGFWDVLKLTNKPVIASHSNCKVLCDVHRNLNDDQIKVLANNGGVIGVNYGIGFLDINPKKVNLDKLLDHVDHIVKLVGSDHVGFGSDFDGGAGFPGLEDVTKIPNVTRGLVNRGYSDKDIEKMLGGNFLRVFRKILK